MRDRSICPAVAVSLIFAILPAAQMRAQAPADIAAVKETAKTFYAAVQRGDLAGMEQVLVVENDPQQSMARSYAELILAGKLLGDAAKTKYPKTSSQLAQGTISPEEAAKIDAATVTFANGEATLKTTGPAAPLTLRKSGSAWRVFVTQPDANPDHRAQQLALIRGMTDALTKATAGITADEYPTVQDAENAVKQKLSAVLTKAMQSDLPTSRPTTRP